MNTHEDQRTYVTITDIVDMDTGKHIEPNMEDEAKYAEDIHRFWNLIGEVSIVDDDPENPNGYIARNQRVGLEIYFTVSYGITVCGGAK